MLNEISHLDYHSPEANKRWYNTSQIKQFSECPAQWHAQLNGDYIPPEKDAFLHGTYVDIALTTPELFDDWVMEQEDVWNRGKPGTTKKKAYLDLDVAINRVKAQPVMMMYLTGAGQQVMTFDDFKGSGIPFRCMLDCVNVDGGWFSDLKTSASLAKLEWNNDVKVKLDYIDHWNYWLPMGLYREALKEEYGKDFDAYIVATEKKRPWNVGVYFLARPLLEAQWKLEALPALRAMEAVKAGKLEPHPCGACDYCILNRRVLRVIRKSFGSTEYINKSLLDHRQVDVKTTVPKPTEEAK